MVVTTRRPSGEIWDMNPTRRVPPSFPRKVLHSTTFSSRTVMRGDTGTMAYNPLSLRGPSRSIPMVFPSREKEWQLAQLWIPVMTTRLAGSETWRTHRVLGRPEDHLAPRHGLPIGMVPGDPNGGRARYGVLLDDFPDLAAGH